MKIVFCIVNKVTHLANCQFEVMFNVKKGFLRKFRDSLPKMKIVNLNSFFVLLNTKEDILKNVGNQTAPGPN